jgi:Cu/Zn superoxide dismutase
MGMPGEADLRAMQALLALAGVAALTACSGVNFHLGSARDEPARPKVTGYGQEANLRAINGSAVFGKIRVIDRGSDDASMLVSMMNIPPGAYRIAFHERPNCSSPNGFSAGALWAPAGRDAAQMIPTQYVNSEDRVGTTIRLSGVRATGPSGVAGHSVVVYAGPRITPAQPDVPNQAIACGVFEAAQPLSF